MITFDNFYALDSKTRKAYVNDIEVLKQMVKQNVSEHRFEHSLSVADTCKSLALKHRVDSNKAYVAGLLHDITKELPDEKQNEILIKHNESDKLGIKPSIKHSYTAKYYLMDDLNINDEDILDAVYYHTICESNKPICKILYIADKREENRHIQDNIVEVAKTDLDKAFKMMVDDVYAYIKSKGEKCTIF